MPTAHDQLFKELLRAFFPQFLELFTPDVLRLGRPASVVFIEPEVFRDLPGSERRRLDVVARVRFAPQVPRQPQSATFLVHVEVQSRRKRDFDRRMFFYFSRLYERELTPIYPIALFTYDSGRKREPHMHQVRLGRFQVVLRFAYRTIELRELQASQYVRRFNPVALALAAKMKHGRDESPYLWFEALRRLARMALDESRKRIVLSFLGTYLPLDRREKVRYNRLVEGLPMGEKRAVQELTNPWELDGVRTTLLLLVRRRFGPMPDEDRVLIESLDRPRLDELAVAVVEVDSYAAWQARLKELADRR
ncbi:RpnC/YadD family protein [Limnochorda pilosa]|uniref:Transposase n=1 Tax=Limnochorda pilosa TaxID=1555112 RepID=A0A0K2SLY7_LIMPI|nr:hypothetical protein [Limnochorda pilosa]BAS28115.1 hypothetical protein LIP_2274 [Limnochorda pilosa]